MPFIYPHLSRFAPRQLSLVLQNSVKRVLSLFERIFDFDLTRMIKLYSFMQVSLSVPFYSASSSSLASPHPLPLHPIVTWFVFIYVINWSWHRRLSNYFFAMLDNRNFGAHATLRPISKPVLISTRFPVKSAWLIISLKLGSWLRKKNCGALSTDSPMQWKQSNSTKYILKLLFIYINQCRITKSVKKGSNSSNYYYWTK